jgi:hypothetical protein
MTFEFVAPVLIGAAVGAVLIWAFVSKKRPDPTQQRSEMKEDRQ